MPGYEKNVAIVTGGGGDIGREVAIRLVAGGADVVLVDRDQSKLDEALVWIDQQVVTKERGAVVPCCGDVTKPAMSTGTWTSLSPADVGSRCSSTTPAPRDRSLRWSSPPLNSSTRPWRSMCGEPTSA